MTAHSFKDLTVWQRSMELVDEIYKLTAQLPQKEIYNLVSQMLRCAVSIPSNIAEGRGRLHKQEFIHFLSIANGSSVELETQLLYVRDNILSSIVRKPAYYLKKSRRCCM